MMDSHFKKPSFQFLNQVAAACRKSIAILLRSHGCYTSTAIRFRMFLYVLYG